MALTKNSEIDRIIIRKPYNTLRLRTKDTITENGTEVTRVFTHTTINAGSIDGSGNWLDTDVSQYGTEVQNIAAAIWTDAVKTAYKDYLETVADL